MLEWTGERFLPWLSESTIAYEHLHRYAYAATLVPGKRVLDLASGEGYGSKILAESAAFVVGMDIDENCVRHAAARYGSATLHFISGSITAIPIHGDPSFDVIVCFEAIEHIEDQERFLAEVHRLLSPHGIFIVSTPNKVAYRRESKEDNPFHVRELEFHEFKQLLGLHFKNLLFLGQRIHPVSSIWPVEPNNTVAASHARSIQEFVMERCESEFRFMEIEKRIPLYFIAVASNSTTFPGQTGSVLVDYSNSLINEKDKELRDTKIASREAIDWREQQLSEREKTIGSLEQAVRWQEGQIHALSEGLDWTRNRVNEMEKTVASHEEALTWRARQVDELQGAKTTLEKENSTLMNKLALATEQLQAIHASSGWKFVLRVRFLRDRLLPPGSSRRKLFEKIRERGKSRA